MGKRERAFEEIGTISFDSGWISRVYAARSGKLWTVVLDGKIKGWYDSPLTYPTFSRDGRRFSFVVWLRGKQVCVVDGHPGNTYDDIGEPRYSPDGMHFAYVATTADGKRIVMDGKSISGIHKSLGQLVFSADSQHVAYVAEDPEGSSVFIDEHALGRRYACIGTNSLIFSEDGTSVAYMGETKQNSMYVAVNDREYGPYQEVDELQGRGYVSFVPGTSHLIFALKRSTDDLFFIDGKHAFTLRCVLPSASSATTWAVLGCLSNTLSEITVTARPTAVE